MQHIGFLRQVHAFQVWFFFFWWLSGEVKHFVHLIRLNLNSRLCPCGLIDNGPVLGITCCFPFRHQLVPHSVPNFSPVPLCNVSWGLGVCPVLVRSVSPCRLVLEVRLFPSLPALFLAFCPSFVSACSLPLAFQGWPGSGRVGVCVCNIWTDVNLLPFDIAHRCRGPEASQQDSGQRRRLFRSVKLFWDARMTYLPCVFRFSNPIACEGIQFPSDHFNDPFLV